MRRCKGGDDASDPRFIYQYLDLSRVLIEARSANGWGNSEESRAEADYREFLWVCWQVAAGQHGRIRDGKVAEPVLSVLARFLPVRERQRFVAEEQGNLGDCEHWWQRVDHLVGLALGAPRLAWMMRRDGRRGQA